MDNKKLPKLLVTASTFPRWLSDSTPPFVAQFCNNIAKGFNQIFVLAPHAKGAKTHETNGNIKIKRFRYFFPANAENIAYGGGAVGKIKPGPVYAIKLLALLISLGWNTFFTAAFKRTRIINAHWLIPQGFLAVIVKKLTGAKVVISVHGGDIFSLNSPLFIKIKRFTLKNANKVVVNSSATLAACKVIYPNTEYAVVPMGVDIEHFKPKKPSPELKKKHGLNNFTILFVGRITREKGIFYLCDALKKLKNDQIDFKALILGDGPEMPKLKEYIQKNDLTKNVELVGWVNTQQLVDYYNVADVFVGPSVTIKQGWKEAFGLVFAESLAVGLPVIATNNGGIVDIVTDGETGYLIKEKSGEAIYEKLKLLQADPALRQKLSKKGRDHIVQNFSWPVITEKYLKIFNEL